MRQVIRYMCENCLKEYIHPNDAESCEKRDKEFDERRNALLAKEKQYHEMGHDVWIESGEMQHAPIVDTKLFGPHDYKNLPMTSDCEFGCGCWMGQTRSGGPINPFGACPKNPNN